MSLKWKKRIQQRVSLNLKRCNLTNKIIPCYTNQSAIILILLLATNATDSGNSDSTIDENRRIIYDAVPNNVIVDDGIKLRIHTDNSDLGFR